MLTDPIVQIPLFAAVAFIVLASPSVFGWVDDHLGPILRTDLAGASDRPTKAGLIVHALVMFLLVFLFLKTYDIVSGTTTFGSLY